MHKILKSLATTIAAVSLVSATAAALAPAASATPGPGGATPYIIGGEQAPATPWEVQLIFAQSGGTYGCTGE